MNIKKYSRIFALSLALGLTAPLAKTYASQSAITIEETQNLKNYDKASARELKAYDELIASNASQESLDLALAKFGQEYDLRYKLKTNIDLLKAIDQDSFREVIKDSQEILNSDDLARIDDQANYLATIISQRQAENPISLDQASLDEVKKATDSFIIEAKPFDQDEPNSKKDLTNSLAAIKNSRSYYLADSKLKQKYDQVLDLSQNYKDDENSYKLLLDFINASDKLNFDSNKYFESQDQVDLANRDYKASNIEDSQEDDLLEESQTIENPSQQSESSASTNESAFLKNEKTASKYKELSDAQKRELDAIDSNKDGVLSDDELEASANYSKDLDQASWLYPFSQKANDEESSQETPSEPASETSTPASNSENELPKTVTIDKDIKAPQLSSEKDEEDDSEEKFDEDKASAEASQDSNKDAASVVKTGIKGIGYIGAILVIALAAYYFLNKKQKDEK